MRYRANRSQRLATKTEGLDIEKFLGFAQFACCMTADCQLQFPMGYPFPIITDANKLPAIFLDFDLDLACTSINRIFNQFLDNRNWTLNHFTSGNLRCNRV